MKRRKRTNTQIIKAREYLSIFLKSVIVGCALAEVVMLRSLRGLNLFHIRLYLYLAAFFLAASFVVGLILMLSFRSTFSRMVRWKQRASASESFDDASLHQISGCRKLYASDDWLLFYDGFHSRLFDKAEIDHFSFEQSAIVLQLKNGSMDGIPCRKCSEEARRELNEWLADGNHEEKYLCPHCLAPYVRGQARCSYCGSLLPDACIEEEAGKSSQLSPYFVLALVILLVLAVTLLVMRLI